MSGSIAAPPSFAPGWSPATMLVLWGTMSLAALVYAIRLAIRDRDPLPVALCAGALVCALNEPIYDILGKLVYARVPSGYVAYTAFGRAIPIALVVGYVPWVGLAPYLLAGQFRAGASRRRLYAIAVSLNLSVAALEVLNALTLHMWRYYGGDSARGVLSGGIIQMSAMPLLAALLVLLAGDRLRPAGRVVAGIVVPAVSLPMVFAATTWPLYVTNYARVDGWVHWAGAVASVLLCALAVRTIIWIATERLAPAANARPDAAAARATPPRPAADPAPRPRPGAAASAAGAAPPGR